MSVITAAYIVYYTLQSVPTKAKYRLEGKVSLPSHLGKVNIVLPTQEILASVSLVRTSYPPICFLFLFSSFQKYPADVGYHLDSTCMYNSNMFDVQ